MLPIEILNDKPRYPYRGLMLDTARRYYSIDSIINLLNVMAAAKFNILHWHIVDDESFPLELKTSFPNLTFNGAFKEDEIYT